MTDRESVSPGNPVKIALGIPAGKIVKMCFLVRKTP